MKKRITSLFLVLCMLLSMTMTVSFATGEETEPVTYPEQCCDGTHAEGTWLPLFATMNALKEERAALNAEHGTRYILPSGNYYMEKSTTFSSTIYIMGDVNICLNGQTLTTGITGANGQFMTYSAALDGVEAVTGTLNLTVCDCSAEKTGTIKATATTGTANAIRVYNGPSAVTIQGGTFSNFMGSGIEVADTTAGTSLTIEGGTITGNGRGQADNGGGVYTKMPFTMTGGIISNNYAKEQGGGIYIGGKTATISGGTIKGNTTGGSTSAHGGGGVYVINKGAVLNMTGGEIIDNTGYRGGGVYAYYWGIFNMSGGTISGNSVTNSTHKSAVYLSGLRNAAELSGGKIIDNNCPGVCVVGKSSADFSGVEITGNTGTQLNIAGLNDNTASETPASMVHYVNVSDGTIGAISTAPGSTAYANLNVTGGKVGTITAGGSGTNTFSISGGRFAEAPKADYVVANQVAGKDNADADYPWTIGDPYTVTVTPVSEGGTVTVDPATSIAGATVTVTVAPEAGYALDTLTVDGTDIKEAKSFVMVADDEKNVVTATFVATSTVMTAEALLATAENGTVTLSDDVCLTDTLAVSDTLVLDLNGYTLTGTTFPYINVPDGAELTIQDSGENGAISGVEGVASGNALIHVAGKVTLEDGKIVDHTLNASGKRGVAVRLMLETDQTTTPEFVMNGGEISGHSTGSTNSRGAIGMYSGTKFTMDGGTISGNTATYGGAFATASSTVAKAITINGGVITGNTATLGGSVMFVDNTDVVITGGNIYGNINSAPTQDSYASALFINCPVVENVGRLGSFTMTGGTIGADTEGTTRNAIYVQRTDANISGSAVIGGAGLRAVNDSNVSGHKAYAKIIGLDSTASVLVNEGTAVVTDAKCEAYSETQNKYTYCGHASGLTYVEAKDATCTEAGNIEYWTCADCGNYFSDSEGQTPIIEVEIPAEHTYGELIEAQEAVHTQTELKGAVAAHYFCDVCDKYFTEAKVETTLEDLTDEAPVHTPDIPAPTEEQAQHCTVCGLELAPKLEHTCTLTHVPANGATCTEDGNIEYWTCTCGKWYSDAEGNSEITDKTTVVIPAEHTYGELIEAQAEVHTQTELKGAVAAHYFCDVCDKYFTEAKVETTLEDLTAEAPVHTPDIPAPTEEQAQLCTVCGLVMAPKLDHTCNLTHVPANGATCTEDGNIEYWTCTCGKWYSDAEGNSEITDKTTVVIPAEHTYGELIEAQDAVHTQTELKGAVAAHYFCDVCDKYFDAEKVETTLEDLTAEAPVHIFDVTNGYIGEDGHANTCVCGLKDTVAQHTEVVVPGKAATETETGLTDGTKCGVCSKPMAEQIVLPVIKVDAPMDVEFYKENNLAPELEGYVFAGWYADAEYDEAHTAADGEAYAKLVPAAVLSVKAQITADTTAESASADMRLVSTVDDLNYKEVGFKITIGDQTVKVDTRTVYSSIVANAGGIAVDYAPTAFHAVSQYFITFTITDIPNSAFGTEIVVTPYWITLDGTEFDGVTNTLKVSDGFTPAS